MLAVFLSVLFLNDAETNMSINGDPKSEHQPSTITTGGRINTGHPIHMATMALGLVTMCLKCSRSLQHRCFNQHCRSPDSRLPGSSNFFLSEKYPPKMKEFGASSRVCEQPHPNRAKTQNPSPVPPRPPIHRQLAIRP